MWFDTATSIDASIGNYDQLHKLIDARARHAASFRAEGAKPNLNQFVVLGALHLNEYGQSNLIVEPSKPDWAKKRVYTYKEAFEAIKAATGEDRLATSPRRLPPPNVICPHCLKGFDLTNFWDFNVEQKGEYLDLRPYLGRTLQQVADVLELRTDGEWFPSSETILQNDKYIDNTPREDYPDWKKNPRGERRNKRKNHEGKEYGEIDPATHVIEPGDKMDAVQLVFMHRNCHQKHLYAKR